MAFLAAGLSNGVFLNKNTVNQKVAVYTTLPAHVYDSNVNRHFHLLL